MGAPLKGARPTPSYVSLTPSASFNGTYNRQSPPPTALGTSSTAYLTASGAASEIPSHQNPPPPPPPLKVQIRHYHTVPYKTAATCA